MSRYYRAPMGDDSHVAVHQDDLLEPAFVKDTAGPAKRPTGKPIVSMPVRPTTATSSVGPSVSPPPPVQRRLPPRPSGPRSPQKSGRPDAAASIDAHGTSSGLTKPLILAGVVVLGLGALVFLVGPSHRAPRGYA